MTVSVFDRRRSKEKTTGLPVAFFLRVSSRSALLYMAASQAVPAVRSR